MEQDKPKNFLILGYTLGIVVVLVATVIFVDQYLKADVRHEYEKKILQAPNLQYQDLRVAEDGRLSNYRWIDQSKGVLGTKFLHHAASMPLAKNRTCPVGAQVPVRRSSPALPTRSTASTTMPLPQATVAGRSSASRSSPACRQMSLLIVVELASSLPAVTTSVSAAWMPPSKSIGARPSPFHQAVTVAG